MSKIIIFLKNDILMIRIANLPRKTFQKSIWSKNKSISRYSLFCGPRYARNLRNFGKKF